MKHRKKIFWFLLAGLLSVAVFAVWFTKQKQNSLPAKTEEVITGTKECQNLINGVVEPLKDFQSFADEEYPEVVLTSREYWDKKRLPAKVIELESENYQCYPFPLEFGKGQDVPGMNIQPDVTKVEWKCELKYQDWQYLQPDNTSQKIDLENQEYICKKEECLKEAAQWDFIWLCAK